MEWMELRARASDRAPKDGVEMGGQLLAPLSNQWQFALLALIVVMGALVWRAHRQVSKLAATANQMNQELQRLARTTDDISRGTTNTEHTLINNLQEYRMAMGNASLYREYLQKLGVAPAGDVEPILEAISDGAMAVSRDGKVLYVNRVLMQSTGISAGSSLQELVDLHLVRGFGGASLTVSMLPITDVLRGETVTGALLRLRPEGGSDDVILSLNGCPARDVAGRVVAAIVVARQVSEEMAMAIEVRRLAEESRAPERTPVG
jgi:hypothetical protein